MTQLRFLDNKNHCFSHQGLGWFGEIPVELAGMNQEGKEE